MIQEQHWHTCDRLLITDEAARASVQVDILKLTGDKKRLKADALIWSLWVDRPHRHNGAGERMLRAAEDAARRHGCKSVSLKWDGRESEDWVLQWYMGRGYAEVEFDYHCSLLVKQLDDNKQDKQG